MERYVAFDIGDKRIGVAVSDPFNTYALPSFTYFRKGFSEDVDAVAQIAAEKGATLIVCGLPVNFDGTEAVTKGLPRKWRMKRLFPRGCAGKSAKITSTRLPRLIFSTDTCAA